MIIVMQHTASAADLAAVVDKIRQVPTGRQGMYSDVPLRTVTIIAATQL